MGQYLHYFRTNAQFDNAYNGTGYYEPWVSYTLETDDTEYNKTPESTYLTFDIKGNGDIYWKAQSGTPTSNLRTLEYKKNDDAWTSITSSVEGTTISVVNGDIVMFRAPQGVTYTTLSDTYETANTFENTTCRFDVKGNIMSLLDSINFKTMRTLTGNYAFACLFKNCNNLVNANELILPATTLTNECYRNMFYACSYLRTSPKLLATVLANGCYRSMFDSCSNLILTPELPATILKDNCYRSMFYNCTHITVAPELPSTTLAEGCYRYMFRNCRELISAPELPATTLTPNCYDSMFESCINLTTAPELPALTLVNSCYHMMLHNCYNLNYIKCLATDISATDCTLYWLDRAGNNSSEEKIFVKNPNMPVGNGGWTWNNSSNSGRGIPYNWTVIDAS